LALPAVLTSVKCVTRGLLFPWKIQRRWLITGVTGGFENPRYFRRFWKPPLFPAILKIPTIPGDLKTSAISGGLKTPSNSRKCIYKKNWWQIIKMLNQNSPIIFSYSMFFFYHLTLIHYYSSTFFIYFPRFHNII